MPIAKLLNFRPDADNAENWAAMTETEVARVAGCVVRLLDRKTEELQRALQINEAVRKDALAGGEARLRALEAVRRGNERLLIAELAASPAVTQVNPKPARPRPSRRKKK